MNTNSQVIELRDHTYYKHAVTDSKTILLAHHKIDVYEEYLDQENLIIKSITLGGKYTLKLGDVVKIDLTDKVNNYKINHIIKKDDMSYLLKTHMNNKTSTYLLPCFGNSKMFWSYEGYLVNSYLDPDLPIYLNLLYRFFEDDTYKKMESNITSHLMYHSTEDLNDEFVLHKLRMPTEFRQDRELFLEGKYSKFSAPLKVRIMMFHKVNKKSKLHGILHKSGEYKTLLEQELGMYIDENLELDSKPDLTEELFDPKEYKNERNDD